MKTKGLGLVVAIFIMFLVICWFFDTSSLAATQIQYLHWNYFSHVIMVVLAIGAIAIGKKDFPSYGFTLKKWGSDLSIAVICLNKRSWIYTFVNFPMDCRKQTDYHAVHNYCDSTSSLVRLEQKK